MWCARVFVVVFANSRGIDHDRATAAQPVKVPRLTWDWPPEAQVEALLWLAGRDPLPATLSTVVGTYADLLATLGKKHGAPVSINDKAVYDALRRLFIAHGSEHQPSVLVPVWILFSKSCQESVRGRTWFIGTSISALSGGRWS